MATGAAVGAAVGAAAAAAGAAAVGAAAFSFSFAAFALAPLTLFAILVLLGLAARVFTALSAFCFLRTAPGDIAARSSSGISASVIRALWFLPRPPAGAAADTGAGAGAGAGAGPAGEGDEGAVEGAGAGGGAGTSLGFT